jgi:ribosomal-protein-alanine N-acetyltransferase
MTNGVQQMIELVDSNPDYVSLWLKWRGEASTLRYNPIVPTPIKELRVRMENMSSDLSQYESFYEFQFFIKFDSELVGTVSLKKTSPMMRYGEIAYEVGEAYHGRGIGTKAVRKFVGICRDSTPKDCSLCC